MNNYGTIIFQVGSVEEAYEILEQVSKKVRQRTANSNKTKIWIILCAKISDGLSENGLELVICCIEFSVQALFGIIYETFN
jgi:hypothetical protein